jgi:hypothetical protein
MSETLLFASITVKINYKPTDRAKRQARKCCHKRRYFGESLLRRIHGGQQTSSIFLLNGLPSWTYGELSFHAVSGAARVLRESKWCMKATLHCTTCVLYCLTMIHSFKTTSVDSFRWHEWKFNHRRRLRYLCNVVNSTYYLNWLLKCCACGVSVWK